MAQSFTAWDARQLIQRHRALMEQLAWNCQYAATQQRACLDDARHLAGSHALTRYWADELLSGNIREGVPPEMRRMLDRLCKAMESQPLSGDSQRLQQETHAQLLQAMARLKPAASSLQWLFTSRQNKISAEKAYDELQDAIQGTYAWRVQSVARELAQLDQQTQEQSLRRFGQDRQSFGDALRELAPELLQQEAPLPELARVMQYCQATLQQFAATDNIIEEIRKKIVAAAERMITAETLTLLKNVPVDELGRVRTGIRFKALKDAGYQTIADIICATDYQLASVYGISEDTAFAMKHYAQQYAEQARSSIRIRLSVDAQTLQATSLVTAICECRQRSSAIDALEELRHAHGQTIARGAEDLQRVGSGIAWALTDTAEKLRLRELYCDLAGLMGSDYALRIRSLLDSLTQLPPVTPAQAWADFERNSIAYFNILETLVPGVLGQQDACFGLPEELARQIQDECFFPEGLKCSLRRYQEWGVKYILHQERVLLGDEMGLGKTVQAIAAMVSLRNTGATHFMVVCPASVIPNWCKEIVEKSRLRATKIHGGGRLSAFRDWQKNGGVAVTNFETTRHLHMAEDFTFDMMIVDEAHYIKNADTYRTRHVTQLGEHTRRLLFMTGTALENKVDEMIALVQMLQPVVASQLRHMAFMSAAPQFRQAVAPVYYRRKREDVLTELPELIETRAWCSMSAEETQIYESTLLHEHYMTVRRVSWNVPDLERSSKARRMREIIADAAGDGRKIIVFSFFRETMAKIHDFLGDICLPPITGSLSPQRRQEIIDDFEQAPAGAVLPAQIQAGGTGLNIQAASVVILCEPQLKPSIENQAISRAYRMGQARNVLVYRLLCEDSIDERIIEMLGEKQALFDAFADKSVSAAATAQEEIALDDKTMGKIIRDEIDRINALKKAAASGAP